MAGENPGQSQAVQAEIASATEYVDNLRTNVWGPLRKGLRGQYGLAGDALFDAYVLPHHRMLSTEAVNVLEENLAEAVVGMEEEGNIVGARKAMLHAGRLARRFPPKQQEVL